MAFGLVRWCESALVPAAVCVLWAGGWCVFVVCNNQPTTRERSSGNATEASWPACLKALMS
jgi:hypothetical protein